MATGPKKISVIIPTLNAGKSLRLLLDKLHGQTVTADEIIVMDSSSDDDTVDIAREFGCKVEVIAREDFSHGRTRNQAAELAGGDILVFMTQDAMPYDEFFLENLVAPVADGRAAAGYARQIACGDAPLYEKFTREYNYPPQGCIRTHEDIERMGIKAIFFSNAASCFWREKFFGFGKFNEQVVMNEDMLFCAKLLLGGQSVAYAAGARVFHSHNYSLYQQFRRYFSIGMFMSQAGAFLGAFPAGAAGREFACAQLGWLLRKASLTGFVRTVFEIFLKRLGVFLGKRSRLLPKCVVDSLDYNKMRKF